MGSVPVCKVWCVCAGWGVMGVSMCSEVRVRVLKCGECIPGHCTVKDLCVQRKADCCTRSVKEDSSSLPTKYV